MLVMDGMGIRCRASHRLDPPGTLHHVIVRGIEGRRTVADDEDRNNFVSRLGKLAAESRGSADGGDSSAGGNIHFSGLQDL